MRWWYEKNTQILSFGAKYSANGLVPKALEISMLLVVTRAVIPSSLHINLALVPSLVQTAIYEIEKTLIGQSNLFGHLRQQRVTDSLMAGTVARSGSDWRLFAIHIFINEVVVVGFIALEALPL